MVGGAMVLDKLPVPGRPTNLDYSRTRAYCTCSRCGWGCLDLFFSSIISHFFLPLFGRRLDIDWYTVRAVKPKTTNQPTNIWLLTAPTYLYLVNPSIHSSQPSLTKPTLALPFVFLSFPSSFSWRAVVSYWRKYVHEVLVNRLGGLSLPRKSVVR